MKILVSGAGGFIGRHVAALAVSEGLSVHTIGVHTRCNPGGKTGLLSQHHLISAVDNAEDVRAAIEKAAPDAILHLAGSTQTHMPMELYRVNAVYAQTILDAASLVCPGAKVLLAGSAAEYGPVPTLDRVHEGVECRPTTLYGITKLAQTLQGLAVESEKLRVVVARIFNCVGPGMPGSLALGSFVNQVAAMPPEGGQLAVGNLDAIRDFISVDQVAAALLRVGISHLGAGEIFNIASGVGQSLSDIVLTLRQAAPCPVMVRQDDQIRGNSAMQRFIGDPTKIETLGISIKPARFEELLPVMLKAARR